MAKTYKKVIIMVESKPIQGYEGLYEITSDGKVWSNLSKKFLSPRDAHGYVRITLYKNGERASY